MECAIPECVLREGLLSFNYTLIMLPSYLEVGTLQKISLAQTIKLRSTPGVNAMRSHQGYCTRSHQDPDDKQTPLGRSSTGVGDHLGSSGAASVFQNFLSYKFLEEFLSNLSCVL